MIPFEIGRCLPLLTSESRTKILLLSRQCPAAPTKSLLFCRHGTQVRQSVVPLPTVSDRTFRCGFTVFALTVILILLLLACLLFCFALFGFVLLLLGSRFRMYVVLW